MFASVGLAQAPATWENLVVNVVPSITITDNNRNVIQSALAFGEFRNVTHAKDILMLLALQSGSKMVYENERGYVIDINQSTVPRARPPLEAALQFYTDFSNVNSPVYSWNRAMANDKNAFYRGISLSILGMDLRQKILTKRILISILILHQYPKVELLRHCAPMEYFMVLQFLVRHLTRKVRLPLQILSLMKSMQMN